MTYHASFCFLFFFPVRCKKKVPATKRFTVHRTSNVLTLSLKRFANFSGGKITKVNEAFSHYRLFLKVLSVSVLCDLYISVILFFSGCRLPRIPEHPTLHVSELRRSCYVRPLCCSGALWLQLSRWPLLLLCQGKTSRCTSSFFQKLIKHLRVILLFDTTLDQIHKKCPILSQLLPFYGIK